MDRGKFKFTGSKFAERVKVVTVRGQDRSGEQVQPVFSMEFWDMQGPVAPGASAASRRSQSLRREPDGCWSWIGQVCRDVCRNV